MKAKQIVLNLLNAVNEEDFDTARGLVTDDMVFDGVMGKRDGADAYFTDMRKMKFKYEILQAFEDGEDVCVIYNIPMKGQPIYSVG